MGRPGGPPLSNLRINLLDTIDHVVHANLPTGIGGYGYIPLGVTAFYGTTLFSLDICTDGRDVRLGHHHVDLITNGPLYIYPSGIGRRDHGDASSTFMAGE